MGVGGSTASDGAVLDAGAGGRQDSGQQEAGTPDVMQCVPRMTVDGFVCCDGKTVPSTWVCDGRADCAGGVDEVGCPSRDGGVEAGAGGTTGAGGTPHAGGSSSGGAQGTGGASGSGWKCWLAYGGDDCLCYSPSFAAFYGVPEGSQVSCTHFGTCIDQFDGGGCLCGASVDSLPDASLSLASRVPQCPEDVDRWSPVGAGGSQGFGGSNVGGSVGSDGSVARTCSCAPAPEWYGFCVGARCVGCEEALRIGWRNCNLDDSDECETYTGLDSLGGTRPCPP